MVGLKDIPMKPKLIMLFLLMGLVPLSVVGWQALSKANSALMAKSYSQLESIREIKKDGIESFFKTINGQIITFSENRMIVDAMRGFKEAFVNVRNEDGLDDAKIARMKKELGQYYTNDFSNEYKAQNHGKDPHAGALLKALDPDSIALQHLYIRANRNPLGSKHLLNDPGDGSAYAALHAKIHPIVHNYLDKFGYYDIFLVDPDTGDIVYSVFKELDFSTSLLTGPYANTNFAEAFKQARKASAGEAVFLTDYKPLPPVLRSPGELHRLTHL